MHIININKIGQNVTEIEYEDFIRILISYRTPVAAYIPSKGYIKTAKKWSMTTTRHINKWLNFNHVSDCQTVPQEEINDLDNQRVVQFA